MQDSTLQQYLAEHPKMTGVLFSGLLLLSQTGSAMAGHGTTHPGP